MSKRGYARISTIDQNETRQIAALKKLGCEKIFIDKQNGKDTHREQFNKMCSYIRENDTVIVTEYSRLARNLKELLSSVENFRNKKVDLISVKENFNTSTPQGNLILTIFSDLAKFERDMILQRQREGIAIAKREGKYHGRKPLPFDEAEFRKECIKWVNGSQTAVKTMSKLNMKPNRFYKKVKELGIIKNSKNVLAV